MNKTRKSFSYHKQLGLITIKHKQSFVVKDTTHNTIADTSYSLHKNKQ